MPELAEQLPPKVSQMRRFTIADLTEPNLWIVNRILKTYPNQTTRSVFGWLREIVDNNEFCALICGEPGKICRSVALAERVALDRLSGKMSAREIFVWCQDPENAQQQLEAIEFYHQFASWAKFQQIDRLIVLERSDVPIQMVRDALGGRLHEFKTSFVRV